MAADQTRFSSAADENRIFSLIKNEIDVDRFVVHRDRCRIYCKKNYSSKDREREIIFDLSIK